MADKNMIKLDEPIDMVKSDEPTVMATSNEPIRDSLIIYALLSRLGKKCSRNEVREAVSASASDNPLDWAGDAISGFGFLCNSGNVKLSAITSSILPALVQGRMVNLL